MPGTVPGAGFHLALLTSPAHQGTQEQSFLTSVFSPSGLSLQGPK